MDFALPASSLPFMTVGMVMNGAPGDVDEEVSPGAGGVVCEVNVEH